MGYLTIRARLRFAALVAVVGAILLAVLTLWGGQRGGRALEAMLEGSVKPLVALQRIDGSLSAVRARAAGLLLDQYAAPGNLSHLRQVRKLVDEAWVQASALSATNDEHATLLKQLREGWPTVGSMLDDLDKAYDAGDRNRVDDLLQSAWPVAHKSFIKHLQAAIPLQEAGAHATYEHAVRENRQAAILAIAVACLLAGSMLLIMMVTTRSVMAGLHQAGELSKAIADGDLSDRPVADRRDELGALMSSLINMRTSLASLVGNIRQTADSIQVASAEVATGNADLSQRTEQTASNLQQAASSMEQLTGTVRHSAESARTANQLAESAASVAMRGGEVVSQVVSTMEDINQSSRRIGDIIGTIDGIAFQTNILALNAAVEAARAGEQGRGFAVVAGEVRSLAQRSAEAAREIKALIGASVDKVETGSKLVADAGSTMSDIVAGVQRVTDIIGEITAGSLEQSEGIAQISGAVSQLDQMTQQNAALVEQSAAAAESLRDQAQRLAQSVTVFRV